MKKLLFRLLVMLACLILLSACSGQKATTNDLDRFIISEGIVLTTGMDEMASNKEFVRLMSASETLIRTVEKMAAQDYSLPKSAVIVELPDDVLLGTMRSITGEIDIPANIKEKLKYKFNGSTIANLINSRYGSETIAAASITGWGKSYLQPEGWTENIFLILEYPGEYSSIASFVQSGEGVISASSVFVKNGDQNILTLLQKFVGQDLIYDQYEGMDLQEMLQPQPLEENDG